MPAAFHTALEILMCCQTAARRTEGVMQPAISLDEGTLLFSFVESNPYQWNEMSDELTEIYLAEHLPWPA